MKRGKGNHPNQTKTPANITCRVIREFKREPYTGQAHNFKVYRVVQWTRGKVQFEVRRVYQRKDGTDRHNQCCGFSLEDWVWMAEHQQEITDALRDNCSF